MFKVISIIVLGFFSFSSVAQDNSKKASKKEAKELTRKENNKKLKELHDLINTKSWMLKIENAEMISGEIINLPMEANFFICENDLATIEFPAPEVIQNGETIFTGLSCQSDIIGYLLHEFKENKNVKLLIQIKTPEYPWLKLDMSINPEGWAVVNFTQSNGVNFTFSGTISSIEN